MTQPKIVLFDQINSSSNLKLILGLQKKINPHRATGLSIPPENIRKTEVACFQGVEKVTSGIKCVDGQKQSSWK